MSNTLIAWAAFYPVLRIAFGGQPDGAGKSSEGLNFPDFLSCTPGHSSGHTDAVRTRQPGKNR